MNTEQNAMVSPIKHKDVYGKTLYYLKITTKEGETLINIGEKTYTRVLQLTQPSAILTITDTATKPK